MRILPPQKLSWRRALTNPAGLAMPFQYRHQLRLQIQAERWRVVWLDNGWWRQHLEMEVDSPETAAQQLHQWLETHQLQRIPHLGVLVSLWPTQPLLLRACHLADDLDLDTLENRLIQQPATLCPDLAKHPDYWHSVAVREGLHLQLAGLPMPEHLHPWQKLLSPQWPLLLWHGPCAIAARSSLPPSGGVHIQLVLLEYGALYLIKTSRGLQQIMQDRALSPQQGCAPNNCQYLHNLERLLPGGEITYEILDLQSRPGWAAQVAANMRPRKGNWMIHTPTVRPAWLQSWLDLFPDQGRKDSPCLHARHLSQHMPLWRRQLMQEHEQCGLETLPSQARQWLAWRPFMLWGGGLACLLSLLLMSGAALKIPDKTVQSASRTPKHPLQWVLPELLQMQSRWHWKEQNTQAILHLEPPPNLSPEALAVWQQTASNLTARLAQVSRRRLEMHWQPENPALTAVLHHDP